MYDLTLDLHSLLRWFVLLTGLAAAGRSIAGWSGRPWGASDARMGLLFITMLDLQFLLGLLLYLVLSPTVTAAFSNPGAAMRDPALRFFLVEHMTGMLIAIVLAHIGRARSKKAANDRSKHRAAAVFYGLALVIILLSIPWPGMPAARPLWPW
jgi:uncharacterized integral membrane protein